MRKIPKLHILLFALTVLTTVTAGAIQKGVNPITNPRLLYMGIPFAATLLIILLSHELSHFFTSRAHHTEASLPYFIPAPTIIGTFGAVIKMRSPIWSRSALIDIGASGPLVGFAFSLAASIIGLMHSVVISKALGGGLELGDNIIFGALSRVIIGSLPASKDVVLNPMAFAGWIGFFVTSLNLIPVGQLDGGHVAFAFMGRAHKYFGALLMGLLIILGLTFWKGWLIWAALLLILGLRHPPVYNWEKPLDPKRKFEGALAFVIFILTFTPMPFKL